MRRSADDAISALRAGFQSCLVGFAEILSSLELVYRRDLISASIDGGMAIIHALKDDPSSSLQSEEDSLSARRSELGSLDRTFELLLSDLRSECVLERSAEDAESPVRRLEKMVMTRLRARQVKGTSRFKVVVFWFKCFMSLCLFRPFKAVFLSSGLATCGFESLPCCGF
ncbi:hypothetical protein Rs2_04874 [Raphanus sativus]|nr:hypothetical protein Rs2_04874 [Raphanus sativus]